MRGRKKIKEREREGNGRERGITEGGRKRKERADGQEVGEEGRGKED